MTTTTISEAHDLVSAVRAAAAVHMVTWESLVPNQFEIDLTVEEAEEQAYSDMARAKARLRKHICETYGISIRELFSLAQP